MAIKTKNAIEELQSHFGIMRDGEQLPQQWQEACQAMSAMLGGQSFVIQDTETLDNDTWGKQSIYEFGAVVYDARTRKAYYVHKYIEQDGDFDFDAYKDEHFATGLPNGFQGLGAIDQAGYTRIKNNRGTMLNGARFISKRDFQLLLNAYRPLPNFAYNAVFDFGHEQAQYLDRIKVKGKSMNLPFEHPYDLMTMAMDQFPEIMGNYTAAGGYISLPKVYSELYKKLSVAERKKYGFVLKPDPNKGIVIETHKALEDIAYLSVPVMYYIFEYVKQQAQKNAHINITNYDKAILYLESIKMTEKEKKERRQTGHRAGFTSNAGEVNALYQARQKAGRIAAGNIDVPAIQFKITDHHYKSVDALMVNLSSNIQDNTIVENAIKNLKNGKTSMQRGAINKMVQGMTGAGGYTVPALLKNIDASLRLETGKNKSLLDIVYSQEKTGLGTIISIHLIPNDAKYLNGITSLKQLPTIQIPLGNSKQLISHYGMSGINQWKARMVGEGADQHVALMLTDVAQCADLLEAIKSKRYMSSFNRGEYSQGAKILQHVVYDARKTVQLAGDFITDDDELLKTRQGTGSAGQLMLRKSMVDFSSALKSMMEKARTVDVIKEYKKMNDLGDSEYDLSIAEDAVLTDIKNILLICGSARTTKALHTEIKKIEANPRYRYLTKTATWENYIGPQIQTLGSVGIAAGVSGENSFRNTVFSTIDPGQLNPLGFLLSPEKRHVAQAMYTKETHYQGRKSRSHTAQRRIYTSDEVRAGIQNAKNKGDTLFGYGYATTEEIDRAWQELHDELRAQGMSETQIQKTLGSRNIGAVDGGALYQLKSDTADKLLSIDVRSAHISRIAFDKAFDNYIVRKKIKIDSLGPGELKDLEINVFKALMHIEKSAYIDPEDFSVDTDIVRASYVLKSPMRSGIKLLSQADQDRGTYQGISKMWYQRILKNKGISEKDYHQYEFLKEMPENFKYNQVGGLVAGTLHAILNKLGSDRGSGKGFRSANEVKNILFNNDLFGNLMKGCVVFKAGKKASDWYLEVTNPNELSRRVESIPEGQQLQIFEWINKLGKDTGFVSPSENIFNKMSNGNYQLSSKYRGMTEIGQYAGHDYTGSGDKNRSDFRFRDSIVRTLNLMSATSGTDLSFLRDYIIKQASPSSKNVATWQSMKQEATSIYERTRESALNDNFKADITIGYNSGNKKYDIDLGEYERAGKKLIDLTDAYIDGHIDPSRFNDTILGVIDQKRRALNPEHPENVTVSLELGTLLRKYDSTGNIAFAASRLFVPYFTRLSDVDKINAGEKGYDLPSYMSAYNKVFRNLERAHASGGEYSDEMSAGEAVFSAIQEVLSYSHEQKHSGWNLGNKSRLRVSSFNLANASNPRLVNQNDEVWGHIGTFDAMINPSNMKNVLQILTLDKDDTPEQKKDKIMAHAQVLFQTAESLFKTNTFRTAWGYINTLIDNKSQKNIDALNNIKAVFFDKNKTLDTLDINQLKKIIQVEAEFITAANTVGSELFNSIDRDKEKGLDALFSRFPYSNGLDVKFVQVYASESVGKSSIQVGFGTGYAVNLDFDGDIPPIWYPLLEAGMDKDDFQKLLKQSKQASNYQKQSTSLVAFFETPNTSVKEAGVIKTKEMDKVKEFQQQIGAAIVGKSLKGKTGELSNLYQLVTNSLFRLSLDENALSKQSTFAQRKNAVLSMLVRAFFEKLTQDAISSKKVYSRIGDIAKSKGIKNPTPGDIVELCAYELVDLLKMIRDLGSYSDDTGTGIKRILDKAKDMGIISVDGSPDRISAQVFGWAQSLFVAEKDHKKANLEFKRIFGVGLDDIHIVRDGDRIISINGQDVSTPEKAQKFIELMGDSSDRGKAERKRMFGTADFNFGLTERMFQVSLTDINKSLKLNDTTIGEVLRNYGGDLDKGLTSIGRLGTRITQLMASVEDSAYYGILNADALQRASKNAPSTNQTLTDFGDRYKFKNKKINEFLSTADDVFGILSVPVYTGAGHIIHFDKAWLANDPTGVKRKLAAQIDYVFSATQIAGALYDGKYSSNGDATAFGTLHHAIVEACINHQGDFFLGNQGNTRIDKEALRKWITEQYNKGGESRQMVDFLFEGNKIKSQYLDQLYNTTNSFFVQANKAGMTPEALAETTHGIVLHVGGKTILIGGTIDEIWRIGNIDYIGDAKTSAFPYLEYVIQLSLYNAIVRAFNAEQKDNALVSPNAKILLTPKSIKTEQGFLGAVIDINALSDQELAEFIEDAILVINETNEQAKHLKTQNLLWKWAPTLAQHRGAFGGGDSGVSWAKVLDSLDKEYPMTQVEKDYRKLYMDPKTVPSPRLPNGEVMPFEDWLLSYLVSREGQIEGEKIYKHHAAFSIARGQYVENWLNTLSATQRASAKEYILKNATGNKNLILSSYVLKQNTGANVDFNKVYENNLNPIMSSRLKTKEEQQNEDMDKELEDVLVKWALSKVNGQGSSAVSTGEVTSTSSAFKFSKGGTDSGIEIGQALLTIKDLLTKIPTITNIEKRNLLQQGVDSDVERLFGSGISASQLDFNNMDDLLKKASEDSIIGRYMQGSHATGLSIQDGIDTGVSQAADRLKEADTEMLEKTKERLKVYKDIVALQKQEDIYNEKGLKTEAEKIQKLKEEKMLQNNITSLKGLEDQIDEFLPEQRRKMANDAGDSARSHFDKEAAAARRQYMNARRYYGQSKARIHDYDLSYSTSFDKLQKNSLLEGMEAERYQQGYYKDNVDQSMANLKQYFSKEEIEQIEREADVHDATFMSRVNIRHKGHDNLWGQLGTQMTGILTRFTQMGAAYKIIGKVREGFNNVIQSAKSLDKAMTDLRIVTGQTGNEAQTTMSKFANLAGQIGVTTSEVASSATAWLRQGYSMVQVNDLVTSSLYLSRLGMISVDEATKDLTSSLKGFKLEAQDAMDVVDKLTALDVKAATTAGEIATGLAQFANLARLNGISIDQASAMVATIADVSQVSGAQAGNSLKMMLSRYGTVKSGKFDSMAEGEENTSLNDVEKVLRRIGISIRDANLQFREFDDVLQDISTKWDTLDNVSKSAVATALAGTRQREAFLVLMENMDKYREFTEVAENSEGTAAKKYLSYTEQLEASQKRVQAAWESLAQNTDIAKFLTNVNNIMEKAIKALPFILKYVTRVIAAFSAYKLPSAFGKMLRFVGPTGGLSILTKGSGNHYLGNGRIISQRQFNALSPEEREGFKKMNNYQERAAGGQAYSSSILAWVKSIATNVSKIANGGSGVDTTMPLDPSNPAAFDKSLGLYQGKNGRWYMKGRRGAMTAKDAQAVRDKKIAELDAKESERMTRQNRSMTGLTVAIGSLTNMLTATKTTANWQKANRYKFGTAEYWNALNSTHEASGDAQLGSMATTGIASVIGGVIGGVASKSPQGAALGTQVGGAVGDLLSKYVIMPLIDAEANNRADRVEAANKQLTGLATLQNPTETLEALSHAGMWSSDQYKEAKEATDEFLGKMYTEENKETRALLEDYLNKILKQQVGASQQNQSLYDIMQQYLHGSKLEREMLARALQVAQVQATAEAQMAAWEDDLNNLRRRTNIKDLGIRFGTRPQQASYNTGVGLASIAGLALGAGPIAPIIGAVVNQGLNIAAQRTTDFNELDAWGGSNTLPAKYAKAGFNVKSGHQNFWSGLGASLLSFITGGWVNYKDQWIDTSSMTLGEQQTAFENLVANELEKGDKADQELIANAKQQVKEIQAIRAETERMYTQMNESYVQEAALLAQTDNGRLIGQMSTLELKELGRDDLIKIVAQYLVDNGKFVGHEVFDANGEVSSYFEQIIKDQLRTNDLMSGIISGGAYKLSEVVGMKNGKTKQEYLSNFASALGITVNELFDRYDELLSKYGDITLGTLLETPDEIRQHVAECSSLIQQMASASGLLGENIENIIKNFPELVKYLDDAQGLAGALMDNIEQYRAVYARKLYEELKASEGFYKESIIPLLKETLSGEDWDAFKQSSAGNANSVSDLLAWFGQGSALAGRVQSIIEGAMSKKVSAEIDKTVYDTMIKTQGKLLERQIENLNKQKEALQDINKQREYENKLIEAKLKLEDAQKEKKRVWREGVGWTYETDQSALEEAEKNLDNVKNEKKISELDLEIERLKAEKEYLDKIPEEKELKNMQAIYNEWLDRQGDLISGTYDLVKALDKWMEESKVDFGLVGQDTEALKLNRAEAQAVLKNLYENAGGNGISLHALKEKATSPGATAADIEAYNNALKAYKDQYDTYVSQGLVDTDTYGITSGDNGENVYSQSNQNAFGSEGSYSLAQGTYEDNKISSKVYYYPRRQEQQDSYAYYGRVYKRMDADGSFNIKEMAKHPDWWRLWPIDDNGNILSRRKLQSFAGKHPSDWTSNADVPNNVMIQYLGKNSTNGQTLPDGKMGWVKENNTIYPLRHVYTIPEKMRSTDLHKRYDSVADESVLKDRLGMDPSKYAGGTLSARGGMSLINERGPEAIITPSGTITSLPSGSGVVPADVTRNVWQLGELAPAILRSLGYPNTVVAGVGGPINNSDSVNIGTINMEVNADASFNAEKFVEALKQQASLNKNNRR